MLLRLQDVCFSGFLWMDITYLHRYRFCCGI